MKRQAIAIELLEDCVFSARAATEGAHESLDYLPGSALLGAVAARLYASLDRKDAYTLFHSGKLRFGDGLPWNGSDAGLPTPFAWHHAKTEPPAEQGRLRSERIYNFLRATGLPGDRQPKQMRGGFIHADGRWSRPAHSLRLKTAIDRDSGRAREGQLFGYDALHRGQRFVSLIEADDDLDQALFYRVLEELKGEALLGRSRSAEYGRVKLDPLSWEPSRAGEGEDHSLTLWLLSDLALVDSAGQPSLVPDADTLGIPGARVRWDKSFLRSRRYSPWNAARHGYDRERLVLAAGSVITLDLSQPLDEAVEERLHAGLGLYREAGLGRVWMDPPLLKEEHPVFAEPADQPGQASPRRPHHPLLDWLEARRGTWKEEAEERAKKLAKQVSQAIGRSRRFAGIDPALPWGPSRSQWGSVMQQARSAATANELYDALFVGDSAVIKSSGEGWNIEIPPEAGNDWQKLAGRLRDWLTPGDLGDRVYIHTIRVMAHRLRDEMDKRRV